LLRDAAVASRSAHAREQGEASLIDRAIRFLHEEVQSDLTRRPGLTANEPLFLCNMTKDDGNLALPKEKVGLTLINIEEERTNKAQSFTQVMSDGRPSTVSPEIRLNLFILFAANFSDYLTAIKYLSAVLGFFQSNTVFTPRTFPALDPEIERLVVELSSLSLEQQNHLWGYLGGKYLPSVLYKVRVVRIQESLVRSQGERIRHVTIDGRRVDV
jgi:hypothetical protein